MNLSRLLASCASILCLLYSESQLTAAGARLLSDLNPGANGSYPSNFTSFGNSLFFSAYTLNTGFELFRTDGTNVTLVQDINPTADDIGLGVMEGNDSLPSWLTVWNDQLFFSAYEPRRGAELWHYNSGSVTRLSDIAPDVNDTIKVYPNNAWPSGLTVFSNVLYFSATTRSNIANYELWSYDGNAVRQTANVQPDTGTDYSSYPHDFTIHDGEMYFSAYTENNGWELYRFVSGTPELIELYPANPSSSSYPHGFVSFGDELFFSAYTEDSGYELWKVKRREATRVADLNPGPASSYPRELTLFDGALYFTATDGLSGTELWKYDGTSIKPVADINQNGDATLKNLTVFNGRLIFAVDNGFNGWELYAYNGMSFSVPALIEDLNPLGDSFPENFVVAGDKLYFTATTPDTGYEVFQFDGEVTLAADVNEGPGDSFPRNLYLHNGSLYFSAAANGSTDWEPWVIDGPQNNLPPAVTISSPQSGATFLTTDSISIIAEATDDSLIHHVEFRLNNLYIGDDFSTPYTINTQPDPGEYTLTAIAFDNHGLISTSAPVVVRVQAPPTGNPPSIQSISITGGALTFNVSGDAGTTFTVHASTDLLSWQPVATGTINGNEFRLDQPLDGTARFYRVSVP